MLLRPRKLVSYREVSDKTIYQDNITDFVIDHDHWNNVLSESSDFLKNINTGYIIYHIRLYHQYNDSYYYKIGVFNIEKTTLKKKILELNTKFNSLGRIIVVQLAHVKNDIIEQKVHKKITSEIKEYRADDVMTGSVRQTKSKESFLISPHVYDSFTEIVRKYKCDNYFDSEDYRYYEEDDNHVEEYKGITLAQDDDEGKYWNKLIFGKIK
jgi:hypothetical protein